MAVKSKDDLLNSIRAKLGDDTSDDTLSLLEDVTDTFNSLSSTSDGEDWKKKYEDNDKQWREKYRDRFFNTETDDKDDDPINEPPPAPAPSTSPTTFEELFKEEE